MDCIRNRHIIVIERSFIYIIYIHSMMSTTKYDGVLLGIVFGKVRNKIVYTSNYCIE